MSRQGESLSEGFLLLEACIHEFRYSLRSLRKAPAFAASTIVVLALAIGANSALFSVVYGVLLRPLSYRDADRLVVIECERHYSDALRPAPAFFRLADLRDWRDRLRSFDRVSFFLTDPYVLSGTSGSQVVTAAVISNSFFSTFNGPFSAGRPLDPSDDLTPSVVIGERLAGQLFDRPQLAIGARLQLNSHPYEVVGVLDRSYALPSPAVDLWVSAEYEQSLRPRSGGFRLVGRLKPGTIIEQARSDLDRAVRALSATHPGTFGNGLRASAVGVRDHIVGDMRSALRILWAAAGLILIASCANVANLLLARNAPLSRERIVQAALGASTGRFLLRGLADGGILAASGAAAGVALAAVVVGSLVRLEPTGLPLLASVRVNVPVLLVAIGLSAFTALAIGVLPVIEWSRRPPTWTTSVRGPTPATRRMGRALSIAELAVAMVLLVGATLLSRSLIELLLTDIGVNTEHVTAASLRLDFRQPRSDSEIVGFVDRIVARIRELPGVSAVGAGSGLPPSSPSLTLTLKRKGDAVDYAATAVTVTPGYFESLGVRLLKGRFFNEADDDAHPPVIILSDATARRFVGDGDPIGRTMTLPTLRNGVKGSAEMTLVGVISAVKYSGLAADADEQVYRPFAQQPWPSVFLVVRAGGVETGFASTLRRQIAAFDPALAVVSIKTLDAIVAEETAAPLLRSILLGAIAFLGVTIAAVGLYGVVAYSVSQRTSEIAVRLALGAHRRNVTRMVLKEAFVLGVSGTAVGLVAAYAVARSLSALVYRVTVTDSASFLLSAGLLLVIVLVASLVPASRAARVEPLVALRME